MSTVLSILDLIVLAVVVFSVARALWSSEPGNSGYTLLAVVITVALLIFGVVSMCAATGLTTSSGFNQGALLIFLVATGIVSRLYWAPKPVR
jgi:hypothetical protein